MKTDYEFGQRDAKVGFYDKWYRYNRMDDGRDYDDGFSSVELHKNGAQLIEA